MGSAGMTAAETAPKLGLKVAAVERGRIGGDCLWTGCVPSKALLASAKAAHTMRTADRFGLEPVAPRVDTGRVWARIREVQERIAATSDSPARFREAGVDLYEGAARLASPTSVQVEGGPLLEGRYVLVCTGSRPAVPPVDGLEEAGFLTSETIFEQPRAPSGVVVVGGGPIAVELAQGLCRLGVDVTMLVRGEGILPRDEPELAQRLAAILRAEGVALHAGVDADRVTVEPGGDKRVHAGERSWVAEEIVVATGRRPNVDGLGLEEAGVTVGPKGIEVDGGLRTSARTVYAAGDVAGRFLFTHSAGFEAARAVRNMFFPGASRDEPAVPWATFTDPELAHAGLTEAQARERFGDDGVEVWRMELSDSDRARAEGHEEGAILVVTHDGKVVGAHALAPGAGELIHELALAARQGMELRELAGMVHVYPTLSLDVQRLAAEASLAAVPRLALKLARGRGDASAVSER